VRETGITSSLIARRMWRIFHAALYEFQEEDEAMLFICSDGSSCQENIRSTNISKEPLHQCNLIPFRLNL
jgi:hypothetical protein